MPTSGEELPPNVRAALHAGDKVEAIKRLREATGLGLKEAKDRVDAGATRGSSSVLPAPSPGALPAPVIQALQAGDKIEAIRLLRQHAGIGLKEAKEAVEGFQSPGGYAPGEVPRRSGLGWLVALGLAVALLYFFFRS